MSTKSGFGVAGLLLLSGLMAGACGNKPGSTSGSGAEPGAVTGPKATTDKEVCLVIEKTFHLFEKSTSSLYLTGKTVEEANKMAGELEATVAQWKAERPRLEASAAGIGDRFAALFAERARLLRAAKERPPEPPPPPLPPDASPQERRKALLRDAARYAVNDMLDGGLNRPYPELDSASLQKNYEQIGEVHGDNLDTCLNLMGY